MVRQTLLRLLAKAGLYRAPFDSRRYWTTRYADGGTSGQGSYGRLAQYKAELINKLVLDKKIQSVIEFGSGDGNQMSLFDFPNYTGVDVVPQMIERARANYGSRPGWSFVVSGQTEIPPRGYDLAMSLDVIYHLVEDDIFERYMHTLFGAADRYVLIYSSDHDEETASHVKSRTYSDWVVRNAPEFVVANTWTNPYPYKNSGEIEESSFAFFRLYEKR